MKLFISLLFLSSLVSVSAATAGHAISQFENTNNPSSNSLFVLELPGSTGYRTAGATNKNISFGQLSDNLSNSFRAAFGSTSVPPANVELALTNSSLDILSGNGGDDFLSRASYAVWNRSSITTVGDNFSAIGTALQAQGALSTEPFGTDVTPIGSPSVAYTSGNTEHYLAHLKRAVFSMSVSNDSGATFRAWACLQSSPGTGFTTTLGSDTPAAIKIVGFRHTSGANWKFITADGSGTTTTDTGIAHVTKTAISLEIRLHPSGSPIYGFINGVAVATNSANIPASSTLLYSSFGIQETSGGSTFRPILLRTLERYGF